MFDYANILYLLGAICFVLSLRGLSSPVSAQRGLLLGILGMLVTIGTVLWLSPPASLSVIFMVVSVISIGLMLGCFIGKTISLTAIPQLIAMFHSLVGLSAVLVSWSIFLAPENFGIVEHSEKLSFLRLLELSIGCSFGMVTFCASVIAFGKLQDSFFSKPIILPMRHVLMALLFLANIVAIVQMGLEPSVYTLAFLTVLSLLLGMMMIFPIGGADMPVAISMLNSYSGWTAAGVGFSLSNMTLIITGALVGSSGAILSYIMCCAMNRSLLAVLAGGFGDQKQLQIQKHSGHVTRGNAIDAAFLLSNSQKVIIVPGYGMAVAKAQHSLKEMTEILKNRHVDVSYAVHPVAGRMPGHMNVLLAEARISYEDIFEMESINPQFSVTDVVYVIGANDVTNPATQDDPSSPIYGMPVLEVWKAKTVLFVKRSLSPGYSGVDNSLFYKLSTMMLFGDARTTTEKINTSLLSL